MADTLEPDVSPLAELLNVAWANHELVAEGSEAAIRWLACSCGAREEGERLEDLDEQWTER